MCGCFALKYQPSPELQLKRSSLKRGPTFFTLSVGSMKPPGKDGAAVTAPVGGSREASSAKESAVRPRPNRPTASAIARTRRTQARRMRLEGASAALRGGEQAMSCPVHQPVRPGRKQPEEERDQRER